MNGPGHPDTGGREEPRHFRDPAIHAGDPLTPLPSEVLGSLAGGQGIAAFVLRPADLDRLPVLTQEPHTLSPAQRAALPHTWGPTPEEPRQPPQVPPDGRYRPHGGEWPEDGVTLTYGELRRLVALHLAQLAHTMGRTQPWLDAEGAAKAMADGETPLRLREVME